MLGHRSELEALGRAESMECRKSSQFQQCLAAAFFRLSEARNFPIVLTRQISCCASKQRESEALSAAVLNVRK